MKYPTLEEVITLHELLIELDGGGKGLRDVAALESAVAQASLKVFKKEVHATAQEKAAAFLFYICQAHAFVDGNKRTAVATMLLFLQLNKYKFLLADSELVELTLQVAKGKLNQKDVAKILKAEIKKFK